MSVDYSRHDVEIGRGASLWVLRDRLLKAFNPSNVSLRACRPTPVPFPRLTLPGRVSPYMSSLEQITNQTAALAKDVKSEARAPSAASTKSTGARGPGVPLDSAPSSPRWPSRARQAL